MNMTLWEMKLKKYGNITKRTSDVNGDVTYSEYEYVYSDGTVTGG